MDRDIVGERLRRKRQERDLTQDGLAEAMRQRGHRNMKQSRISEIELGKRSVLPAELIGFSRVLRCRITDLLGVLDSE